MTCCRYPSESECPAWDAWANRVAEAIDPSSLVSEYAACGVWRPHTVLPFSRMSLVAYLRGWEVEEMVGRIAQAREGKTSVWEMLGRFVQARESVCDIVGRLLQMAEAREAAEAVTEGVTVWGAGGDRQRSDITLARIVDVLGVAAPHGPAVVWYATRRVHARMGPAESEYPTWDAWANRVAEANDPSSLVSEYAACGVWRPHTVLPFSRMSLVAYLRGWAADAYNSGWEMVERFVQARLAADAYNSGWEMVERFVQARLAADAYNSGWEMVERFVQARLEAESVWEMVGRIAQAREVREQKDPGAGGVSRGVCCTT
ncbi:hypothetical protein TGRH88_084370 [Toxoplasma gondii]|uniref:Uncharacterized protein n=1 Tax=Toxoplasma gondii TaxID=5811 RepID=A0A7J6KGV3_TOXGO|nr:hypothetical protein TGRH88_084370 [Toxoplasma gondii]